MALRATKCTKGINKYVFKKLYVVFYRQFIFKVIMVLKNIYISFKDEKLQNLFNL